ncbi:MAG: putative Ig domain-containing protein, partial [Lachnospiraceae bacterium]|nr:putative Ig domain-containing protein [Lachnospiraceae bacterium]
AVDTVMNEAMLNRLIRDEWGWKGQYVTDFYTAVKSRHMDLLIRSGCDLPDGTANGLYAVSGTWKADAVGLGTAEAPEGNVVLGEEEKESLLQWYYARICAERVLYVAANTMNNRNGVDVTPQTVELELKQGEQVRDAFIALPEEALNGCDVVYTVTSGELPAGLSYNAATGALTGTPSGSGTAEVVITAAVSGWLKARINATIRVASAFTLSDGENDVEAFTGKVGEEFEGFIDSETITSEKFNKGITYAVADGYALPKGLTITDGVIEGTPEEAGTFETVINVIGTNETSNGRRTTTTRTTYTVPVTFTIEEGEETPVESTVKIRVEEGFLQFTTDGETWTNLIAIEELKALLK